MNWTSYPLLLDEAIEVRPPPSLVGSEQCACVHPDRHMCIAWRTDRSYEQVTEVGDECQCACHDEEEDADESD